MSLRRYATRADAIYQEIVRPIEAGDARADDYALEAIALEVLGDHAAGYRLQVDPEGFWSAVERHARPISSD